MEYPPEPAEDDKNPRPLDLDGREIALRSPRLGNTAAPHQYSKSESEDTLPESVGCHDVLGEAIKAIKAEYEQLCIKNMAEAEDMKEKQRTTVGETEEVYNLHIAEYMNCYKKARGVADESSRRLAEVRAEFKCMLNRAYVGEEISLEEQIRCLEKIYEKVVEYASDQSARPVWLDTKTCRERSCPGDEGRRAMTT